LVDDDWLALVRADIDELLAGTTLAGAPVVACSALRGDGLDELATALDAAVDALPPKRDLGRPRLPIDRVFTIGGFGTVVTGTLIDGELATGAEVEVVPGGMRGRIRGLQSHRDSVDRVGPGTRTAVNVSGIEKELLRRGHVLAAPGSLRATDVVDARLRAVPGLRHALRHNMHVTFHCFADEAAAQVRLLEGAELRPGESGWAQIKLDRPVAIVRGDRFVLRTPNETVGGGIVADAAPRRHKRGDVTVLDSLEVLLSDVPEDVLLEAVTRRPLVDPAALAADLAMPRDAVDAALMDLAMGGSVVIVGEDAGARVMTSDCLRHLMHESASMLDAYHREHPLRPGMPQEELRARLGIEPGVFAQMADLLPDVRIIAATAALASFEPSLTAAQEQQAGAWLDGLRASPGGASGQRIEPALLAYLVEAGRVVDAGDGVVFDAAQFDEMAARVRAHIEQRGAITLAQARDLFGTSRKHAQALLEQLDRGRVTRRVGDERVLR
jgi:selenocysteine-specific elongation factor